MPWYPQHGAYHTVGLKQYVWREERRNGEKDRWQGEGMKEGKRKERAGKRKRGKTGGEREGHENNQYNPLWCVLKIM